MASRALHEWQTVRAERLDELESACAASRGRRAARRQIVHAYAVFLASEFQGFCRGLHTETAQRVSTLAHGFVGVILERALIIDRRLGRGNANLANIAADFGRFDIGVLSSLAARDHHFGAWREALDRLGVWRNAIAHDDYSHPQLGGRRQLTLGEVRRFRHACDSLVNQLDAIVTERLRDLSQSGAGSIMEVR